MTKKILLIAPPIRNYFGDDQLIDDIGNMYDLPYGLLSIGTYIRQKTDASIHLLPIDYHLNCEHTDRLQIAAQQRKIVEEVVQKVSPDIVGVTAYTIQFPNALRILEICKEIDPRILTVIGGPHVTFMDREALECNSIDVVVRGEGEETLLELVESPSIEGFDFIKGISYKNNGQYRRNDQRNWIDLQKVRATDFSLLPNDYIAKANVEILNSRGCLSDCTFCASTEIYNKKVRFKNSKVVIDEIKTLSGRYGVSRIGILDDTFNANYRYFKEFCDRLSLISNTSFIVQTRADMVNDDNMKLMRKANIKDVIIGAESASPSVLKIMNKRIEFDMVKNACTKLKSNGFKVGTYWITGHPGSSIEDEEISLKAIEFLLRHGLCDYFEISVFVPYPGTTIFQNQQRFGLEITDWNYEHWGRLSQYPVYSLNNFKSDIYACWLKANELLKDLGKNNAKTDWRSV